MTNTSFDRYIYMSTYIPYLFQWVWCYRNEASCRGHFVEVLGAMGQVLIQVLTPTVLLGLKKSMTVSNYVARLILFIFCFRVKYSAK